MRAPDQPQGAQSTEQQEGQEQLSTVCKGTEGVLPSSKHSQALLARLSQAPWAPEGLEPKQTPHLTDPHEETV